MQQLLKLMQEQQEEQQADLNAKIKELAINMSKIIAADLAKGQVDEEKQRIKQYLLTDPRSLFFKSDSNTMGDPNNNPTPNEFNFYKESKGF